MGVCITAVLHNDTWPIVVRRGWQGVNDKLLAQARFPLDRLKKARQNKAGAALLYAAMVRGVGFGRDRIDRCLFGVGGARG